MEFRIIVKQEAVMTLVHFLQSTIDRVFYARRTKLLRNELLVNFGQNHKESLTKRQVVDQKYQAFRPKEPPKKGIDSVF